MGWRRVGWIVRRPALRRARPVLVLAWILGVPLVVAGAVQWQAPAGCPEAAAVERRVEDLLGRTPGEDELRAVGVVHAGPPWRLELETTIGGHRQRRSLRGDDCRAVAEAAALILAVSVDPIGVDANAGPRDEPELDPLVPPGPVLERELPPAPSASASIDEAEELGADAPPGPSPRARARGRLRIRVGGGGELGAIPGGTGGARGGLELEGDRALLRLEGSYWIDRLAALSDDRLAALSDDSSTPRGALVGLGTVAVKGGVRLGGTRVSVPLVVGLEAGGLRTSGVGLVDARRFTLPWAAGVIGTGVRWSITPRVALWAAFESMVPLVRLRVRVGRADGGSTLLHEPAVVGGRALVGLSFEIPSVRVTDGVPSGDERRR